MSATPAHGSIFRKTVQNSPITDNLAGKRVDESEATVFISYSRKDLIFVDQLDADLQSRGIKTFVDRTTIAIGEDWFARLKDLIARAETIIFVVSPASIDSEICAKEVEHGKRLGKRFIPVVANRVDAQNVPVALSSLNYVFLDEEETYVANVDRLVTAIRTDLAWMRTHADLGRTAEEWSQAGRPRGLLLGRTRLEAAEQWIAHRPINAPLPTDNTHMLVAASRRHALQWRNGIITSLILIIMIIIGFAVTVYRQNQVVTREKNKAETAFSNAKRAADGLIFQIAQRLRGRGLPIGIVRDVLNEAETLMTRLVEAAPNDRFLLRSQAAMYTEFSETYEAAGEADEQKKTAAHAVSIARLLAESDPDNAMAQRELATSLNRIGIAEETQGRYVAAQRNYDESLAISRRLIKADPSNVENQRSLVVSLDGVGGIRAILKDAVGARSSYEESLAINQRLAEADPSNIDIQNSLALSLAKVGEIQAALDDFVHAQENGEESIKIFRQLAEADPYNAGAQRNLVASLSRLGNVQERRNDLAAAQRSHEESLAVSRRLAEADHSNAGVQRDLSVSLMKIGEMQEARNDLTGAQTSYDESVAIRRRLAEANPLSAYAQKDLCFSLLKAGSLQETRRNLTAAKESYDENLSIVRRLAHAFPSDDGAQRDLATGYARVGDVQADQGDFAAAQRNYDESLTISRRLAEANPSSARDHSRTSIILFNLGTVAHRANEAEMACTNLSAGREILLTFRTRTRQPTIFSREIKAFDGALDNFGCSNPH